MRNSHKPSKYPPPRPAHRRGTLNRRLKLLAEEATRIDDQLSELRKSEPSPAFDRIVHETARDFACVHSLYVATLRKLAETDSRIVR